MNTLSACRSARRSRGAVAAALLLSLVTAHHAAFAADEIKIGVPVGLSGANSVVAPSVVQSAQLAVEEINAKGGILGRQVRLEVADDGSGAAGAQKAFDSLIFDKKVNDFHGN
jgi:urea transport system substrate-binding protein